MQQNNILKYYWMHFSIFTLSLREMHMLEKREHNAAEKSHTLGFEFSKTVFKV